MGVEVVGRLPAGAVDLEKAQPGLDRADDTALHPIVHFENIVEDAARRSAQIWPLVAEWINFPVKHTGCRLF